MTQHNLNLNNPLNDSSINSLSASKRWSYLLTDRRLGRIKKDISKEKSRTPFHKDYDRLVFSQSFRQLNQKTQVHPLTNQMGIHTRLTHSLEVSCIGRSLGMMAAESYKINCQKDYRAELVSVMLGLSYKRLV